MNQICPVLFLGTAGLFAIQKVLQKRLPYALQWNLLISIGEKHRLQMVNNGVLPVIIICFLTVQRCHSMSLCIIALPFVSTPLSLPSGVVSRELCSHTLGNTEVFRPVDFIRNRQSSRQITSAE